MTQRGWAGVWSFFINTGGAVFNFFLVVSLTNWLTLQDFGEYTFALSVLMLLLLVAQFGVPQLVIRETASNFPKATMFNLWRWADRVSLSLSLLVLVSTMAVLNIQGQEAVHVSEISISLLSLPVLVMLGLTCGKIRGMHYVIVGQIPEVIVRPAVLLILVSLVILFPQFVTASSEVALLLYCLSSFCAFIFSLLLINYLLGKLNIDYSELKMEVETGWWRSSSSFAFIAGVYFVNSQLDLLLLGGLVGAEAVGAYKIALALSALVSFGLMSINKVSAPSIVTIFMSGDVARLQQIVGGMTAFAFFAALPIVCAITLFSDELLLLFFSESYLAAAMPLKILCAGEAVNVALGSVSLLLIMTGYERAALIGVGIGALSNVFFNLLLIPSFGMTGAAVASALSTIIWNIYLWRQVRGLLDIDSSIFGFLRHRSFSQIRR